MGFLLHFFFFLKYKQEDMEGRIEELTRLVKQISASDTGPSGDGQNKVNRRPGLHRKGIPPKWNRADRLRDGMVVALTAVSSRQNVKIAPNRKVLGCGQFGQWARFRLHKKGKVMSLITIRRGL